MSEKGNIKIPVIAILGRPNVGKSTLFNRLSRKRIAIVDDLPGVTRDRLYSRMDWNGMAYNLIDTGGWVPEEKDELHLNLEEQLKLAISEAELIIFLLDVREGLNPADQMIVEKLRRVKKPVFFVANKADNERREKFAWEFYQLGVDKIFPISALHGRGVAELIEAIAEKVPGPSLKELEQSEAETVPKIAVIGRPNVGKSSLINLILGEQRLLVASEPGTTRDAVDTEVKIGEKRYIFIDTAGIRRKSKISAKLERISALRAIKAMERADIALLLLDPMESATDQDARLGGLFLRRERAGIILLNKWDLVPKPDVSLKEIEKAVRQSLWHLSFAPVIPISAKTGYGMDKLFPLIDRVYQDYQVRIGTGELNRMLGKILAQAPLPNYRGKPLKIYYTTQTRTKPPGLVFFVNYPEIIKEPFKRFLANQLIQEFQLIGTPLALEFRARKKRA